MDNEKVIRRLKQQIRLCKENDSDWISLTVETGKNILEVMEERTPEAVAPEIEADCRTWWYVCGVCHGNIDTFDSFCRHCGRKIRKEAKEWQGER